MIGRNQRPVVAGDRAMDEAENLSSTQDVQSTGEGPRNPSRFFIPRSSDVTSSSDAWATAGSARCF